jgi:hypothetical protein
MLKIVEVVVALALVVVENGKACACGARIGLERLTCHGTPGRFRTDPPLKRTKNNQVLNFLLASSFCAKV